MPPADAKANGEGRLAAMPLSSGQNWSPDNKRELFFLIAYVLVALTTIVIPFKVHAAAPTCTNTFWHWRVFHAPLVLGHTFGSSQISLTFDEFSIWELFGIVQATLFAILTMFEPARFTRAILLVPTVVVAICSAAIFCLGNHLEKAYQITLIIIPMCFLFEDVMLYKIMKDPSYSSFIWFVDGPLLATIVATMCIVGIPLSDKYKIFFSGAIAFQLMLGNTLVLAIRVREATLAFSGLRSKILHEFNFPNAKYTRVEGITRAGVMFGSYEDEDNKTHAFVYERGRPKAFDVPGAVSTVATAMTDSGGIVGEFTDTNGTKHGFLLDSGKVTAFSILKR